MLAYHPSRVHADSQPLNDERIEQIIGEVVDPRRFLIADSLPIRFRELVEEVHWELFRGQALDRSRTRERRVFQSWHVALDSAGDAEPLLALRWDRPAAMIHVTRAILCRIHEAVETAPGVIESRPATGWVRELVGSVALADVASAGRLRDELAGLLLDAVVGINRLPLTSIESPLPQFSLGQLAYGFDPHSDQSGWLADLADPSTPAFEKSKRLEAALRFESRFDVSELTEQLLRLDSRPQAWLRLLGNVFNGVSLTPYTDFVTRALQLARRLAFGDAAILADFLSRLTLLLDEHLTAYDLIRFHHGGANYPDALLLDAIWREWLRLLDEAPTIFEGAASAGMRRRAVRQLLVRRIEYAGRRVPTTPTSSGDQQRVLIGRGTEPISSGDRVLFADPLPERRELWRFCEDLADPTESHRLGRALFIDRPMGVGKRPGEPDRTPLLSHVLVSRSIAERRLMLLEPFFERMGDSDWFRSARRRLHEFSIRGVPTPRFRGTRPGAASLADAAISADDWLVLSTTRSSLRILDSAFRWTDSGWLPSRDWLILLPADSPASSTLIAYGSDFTPIVRCEFDPSGEFRVRGGIEYPAAGLTVRSLRADGDSAEPLVVPPDVG